MTEKDYPTKLGRIGSILALIASTVFVQWPINFSEINIAAVIGFIAALVTWMAVEAVEFNRDRPLRLNELDADAEKLNQLMSIFHRNAYYYFCNTELQTYIDHSDIEPLHRLLSYQEDDLLPFHNPRLEEGYQQVVAKAREYVSGLWGLYTGTGDGRATWRPARDEGYVSDEHYKAVMDEKRRLNDIAWSMADDWKNFIAVAKGELRGSSIRLEMPRYSEQI
jgi:hypothetical protein